MAIQKYDWVSKYTKLNANGWSDPLMHSCVETDTQPFMFTVNRESFKITRLIFTN